MSANMQIPNILFSYLFQPGSRIANNTASIPYTYKGIFEFLINGCHLRPLDGISGMKQEMLKRTFI